MLTRVGIYGPHTQVKCLLKALIFGTYKDNILIQLASDGPTSVKPVDMPALNHWDSSFAQDRSLCLVRFLNTFTWDKGFNEEFCVLSVPS